MSVVTYNSHELFYEKCWMTSSVCVIGAPGVEWPEAFCMCVSGNNLHLEWSSLSRKMGTDSPFSDSDGKSSSWITLYSFSMAQAYHSFHFSTFFFYWIRSYTFIQSNAQVLAFQLHQVSFLTTSFQNGFPFPCPWTFFFPFLSIYIS